MIDQGLSTEARAYFQNEPSLSIDKNERICEDFIFGIVFITIIMTIIQSIFRHIHLKHLYSVPVSV